MVLFVNLKREIIKSRRCSGIIKNFSCDIIHLFIPINFGKFLETIVNKQRTVYSS